MNLMSLRSSELCPKLVELQNGQMSTKKLWFLDIVRYVLLHYAFFCPEPYFPDRPPAGGT
jgi:hypothetical protein